MPDAPRLSSARRVHRNAARRQSARRGARRRRPRRPADAGDRRRIQPTRDRVRFRAARSGQHRRIAHLHPRPRTAVRRPSDGRRGGADRPFACAADARRPGPAPGAGGKGRRRGLRRPPPPRPGAGGLVHPGAPATGSSAQRRRPTRSPLRLGLAPADIGFAAHRPSVYSAGADFVFAPLASLEALGRADPDRRHWGENQAPAIYCYTPFAGGADYRARMFAAGWGIREDPATGSAAAALAGVAHAIRPARRRRTHRSDRPGRRDGPAEPHRPGARSRERRA